MDFYKELRNNLQTLKTEIFYTANALIPHEDVDGLQEDYEAEIQWIKDRIADLQKDGDIALSQHYLTVYIAAQKEIKQLRDILAQFA